MPTWPPALHSLVCEAAGLPDGRARRVTGKLLLRCSHPLLVRCFALHVWGGSTARVQWRRRARYLPQGRIRAFAHWDGAVASPDTWPSLGGFCQAPPKLERLRPDCVMDIGQVGQVSAESGPDWGCSCPSATGAPATPKSRGASGPTWLDPPRHAVLDTTTFARLHARVSVVACEIVAPDMEFGPSRSTCCRDPMLLPSWPLRWWGRARRDTSKGRSCASPAGDIARSIRCGPSWAGLSCGLDLTGESGNTAETSS